MVDTNHGQQGKGSLEQQLAGAGRARQAGNIFEAGVAATRDTCRSGGGRRRHAVAAVLNAFAVANTGVKSISGVCGVDARGGVGRSRALPAALLLVSAAQLARQECTGCVLYRS